MKGLAVGRNDRAERKGEDSHRAAEDVPEEGRTRDLPDEDVQVGPELTDRPRAGSTEPPD